MSTNRVTKFVDGIVEKRKERTRDVLRMISESMREYGNYDKYLERLRKKKVDLRIKNIKNYFSKQELEYFNVNVDKFNISREERLKKIIVSKQNELVKNHIDKIVELKELTFKIKQKYEANKEIIYYYLYEQDLSEEMQKIRNETNVAFNILSEPDEFTEKIFKMRNENTQISSISEYLSIALIADYETLEKEIEKIKKQINHLSEMRIFIDIYFELIPKVILSLPFFDFNNSVKKVNNNNRFIYKEDNIIDVIKIAYFFITDNFFRNNFIEEYSIIRNEIEENKNEKTKKGIQPLKEFADIQDLKWGDIIFNIYYIPFRKNGESKMRTMIDIEAKTKDGIIRTGKKKLSYFGFESRSTKKDSILFQFLKELYDGVINFKLNNYSLLRDHDKCNRFRNHIRKLFPAIQDRKPIPWYKDDIFPEPKFIIQDEASEKSLKDLEEADLKIKQKKIGIEAYELLR